MGDVSFMLAKPWGLTMASSSVNLLPHTITLKYTCDSKPIPPRILSINTDSLLDDDLRFSSIRTMIAERRVSISLTITASRKA